MSRVLVSSRWVVLGWLLLGGSGCSEAPIPAPAQDAAAGEIGLGLDAGSLHLESASFRLRGPNGFDKSGSIDVSHSTKVATTIGGLPPGAGYSIELSADAANPEATCAGSARFDVAPGMTTRVELSVQCHLAHDHGGVDVGGTLDTCPVLDDLSATPSEVVVGGTVTLAASAHDSDAGPSPIAYAWSAGAGTLSAQHSTATWQCSEPGLANVTVVVTDGNPNCQDSDSVDITCVASAAPEHAAAVPAPVPTPAAGLFGLALLALGASRTRRRVTS